MTVCPMCLGKGYATDEDIKEYPHRCPNCDGKGFYSVDWQKVRCEVCNGSGKKPMTNEEYLKSRNTEQLTKVFFEYRYVNATPKQKLWLSANEDFVKGGIVEWLKKPHTD